MKKDELTEVIEVLKEYDLFNSFSTIESAESWLLCLNHMCIENIKKIHNNQEFLNSHLRKVLINSNLLHSENYMKILQAFLKLDNVDNIDEKLLELCFRIIDVYHDDLLFTHQINLISKMNHPEYGIELLKNSAFINSGYCEDDLVLISVSDEIKEKYLCMVAGSVSSLQGNYHLTDMQKVGNARWNNSVECLAKLACNDTSLASKTHEEDMDLLQNCAYYLKDVLYELMTNPSLVGKPNYELERDSIIHSFSNEKASAKLYLMIKRKSIEEELLSYLLSSIDCLPDNFVTIFMELLGGDDFFNSPYLKEDIELLKQSNTHIKFKRLCNLMLNKYSLESTHHIEDVKCILEEEDDKKQDLLVKVAKNTYNLNSITHRYDMNFIRMVNFEELSEYQIKMVLHYLFDLDGISSSSHVDVLQKIRQGLRIESPIEKYFKELESQTKDIDDGENINILRKK